MMTTITQPRWIQAVFKKQLKDTLKNKSTLIQFLMFPMLAFIFTETIAKAQANLPDNYFNLMFATIYIGFVPMVTTAAIISEEKEQHTLKALIMANVHPWQYLTGICSYIFILCGIGSCAFGLIGGYHGVDFLKFMLVMLTGVVGSLLLGATIGILSQNQMSATALAVPLAMITAFLPMIAAFNDKFEAFSKILYTQQINTLISDITAVDLAPKSFLIIGLNMLVFVVCLFSLIGSEGCVKAK